MATIYCPNCGTQNDASARFCDNCGRQLADVAQSRESLDAPAAAGRPGENPGGYVPPAGMPVADDGLPVGEDIDGEPGGERQLWRGRPSKLWSPIMSLTNRYRLTNERLTWEYGFIGRRTEEVDLYRINDVAVKQHPFERVTRMGDITIYMSDASHPTKILHNVPDPERVKDIIRAASRVERQRRRVLLREDMGVE